MNSDARLVIEPLARQHDRATFSCGTEALDTYLRKQAGQDVRRRVARVFVCREDGNDSLLGFYTLSSLSIEQHSLPAEIARKLPKYPVPAALVGRLAVAKKTQGKGIGKMLLADAVKRVLSVSETIAVYAIVVDAKDEAAANFYRGFGFIPLPEHRRRLFLPLGSMAQGRWRAPVAATGLE